VQGFSLFGEQVPVGNESPKRQQRSQKSEHKFPKRPFVDDGNADQQKNVGDEQNAMCQSDYKIGSGHGVLILEDHGEAQQQERDAFHKSDNPKPA